MRYSLRTLFLTVTIVMVLTVPAYEFGTYLWQAFNPRESTGVMIELPPYKITPVNTVITVPDRGTILR